MSRRVGFVVAAGALIGGSSACIGAGQFVCADDQQCVGGAAAAGTCEPDGYCSIPDGECASGRRYDDTAPDELAGRCVSTDGASAGDGVGSGSASGSSSLGTTSPSASGTSTTGTTTGTTANPTAGGTSPPPDSNPYTPCMAGSDCAGGYGCTDVNAHNTCSVGCRDASTCPPSNLGPVGCFMVFGFGQCTLACVDGGCPPGMQCVTLFPGNEFCGWPE